MKSRKDKRPDHTQDDRRRNDALNKSPHASGEKRLPGEYPANEDAMNRMNMKRVGMDVENFSRMVGPENLNMEEPVITDANSIDDEPQFQSPDVEERRNRSSMEKPVTRQSAGDDEDQDERSESDVTDEDLEALGPKDLSMDGGEDEQLLKNRTWPVDMAGSDLDVPGSELDDKNESLGSEDEENNSYSLGGDAHEDNLEGK